MFSMALLLQDKVVITINHLKYFYIKENGKVTSNTFLKKSINFIITFSVNVFYSDLAQI